MCRSGCCAQARHDEVDERLEQLLLGGRVVGPPAPERTDGAVGAWHDDAEEVLEPEVAHVRVALDVEEDVAGAGRRQHLEATVGSGVEQLVGRQLVGPAAGRYLEACLAHRLGQRGGGQAPHGGGGGVDRGEPAMVVMPAAWSLRAWSRPSPATPNTRSSTSRCDAHRSCQAHTAQCDTSSG